MACDPRNMSILGCTADDNTASTPSLFMNNSQCLSSVMAHTGICVDPTNVAPINCNRHQAPHGYKYIDQNGVCLLMRTATGQIVTRAGYAPPVNPILAPVNNVAGNIVAGATNWVTNNKGLAAVIGLGIIWFVSKSK